MHSFSRLRNSNYLLFFGLCLLVTGLPVSLFLTSLSQFVIAGSFFLEGNLINKIKRFAGNKTALLFVSIWILHVIGLFWTQDLAEGIKDVRIKLPLLILPLVLAGSDPFTPKQFRAVLYLFLFSVFSGSMVSMAVLNELIPAKAPIHDIREIFILGVSHIRFALFTCLAVFIAGWLLSCKTDPPPLFSKIILGLLIAWLILFLFLIDSITGISILIITGLVFLSSVVLRHPRPFVRVISAIMLIGIPLSLFLSLKSFVKKYSPKPEAVLEFDKRTKQGNPYFFDTLNTQVENGYRVYAYICEAEMRAEWNTRSRIPFDSLDQRKQPVKSTLLRFLTSKGEYKDAESVSRLTEEEIRSVERGIANVYYQNLSGIKSRLLQILWEYHEYSRGGNPSGHSVTQRIEFWKAATGIISVHPLAGVGTGDMRQAYAEEYANMHSKLTEPYRLRSHNQYLAIGVGLGIPALVYFLFVFFFPLPHQLRNRNFLFLSFWLIAFFSMFTEDTLETQAGATFVALFWSLFLFSKNEIPEPGTNPL